MKINDCEMGSNRMHVLFLKLSYVFNDNNTQLIEEFINKVYVSICQYMFDIFFVPYFIYLGAIEFCCNDEMKYKNFFTNFDWSHGGHVRFISTQVNILPMYDV